jgi:hypothetical protein
LITFACLATGNDSHVKAASAVSRLTACIIRASAHILSHASKIKISHTTNSLELINTSFPFLITLDFELAIFFSDSIDFSALYSCINHNTAFKITIATITIASTASHTKREIPAAAININIKKLLN